MEQMSLAMQDLPLSPDAIKVLDRMAHWVPSGVGAMRFSEIRYQLNWNFERASKAVCELEERGVIVEGGPCGEFYIREKMTGPLWEGWYQ